MVAFKQGTTNTQSTCYYNDADDDKTFYYKWKIHTCKAF